jgi:TolA-binding protein
MTLHPARARDALRAETLMPKSDHSKINHRLALALALAWALAGCAYYNTFYLARKNFDVASQGKPYPDERVTGGATQTLDKSINFSKIVISRYPKSKWVDDAYLLWARALLGKGDPFQAAEMLERFDARYPNSPIRGDARFFLAVAYRHARKPELAIASLDSFQATYPKHDLASYAWLERARIQLLRRRYHEAGAAADVVMLSYGGNKDMVGQALRARAQALFERGAYDSARADFRLLGGRATTDDERLDFLLREAECLAKSGDMAGEIALLDDQLKHESVTATPGTAGRFSARRARLLLRLGAAYGRASENEKAVNALSTVVADYAKQPVAAEAQFQLGYFYEVRMRDFARARLEYGKVRDQSPGSEFVAQAQQRVGRLDRLEQLGSTQADSLSRLAEKEFNLAEIYLLEMGRLEDALEQYRKVARDYPVTHQAARALNAAGWILSRRLGQPEEADSLFWRVIHEFRGTEEALAARDYLEAAGHDVPDSLIVMPLPPPPPATAVSVAAAPAPASQPDLAAGLRRPGSPLDSLLRQAGSPFDSAARFFGPPRPFPPDTSLLRPPGAAPPDTAATPQPPADPREP